jgi:hypothetical protein
MLGENQKRLFVQLSDKHAHVQKLNSNCILSVDDRCIKLYTEFREEEK